MLVYVRFGITLYPPCHCPSLCLLLGLFQCKVPHSRIHRPSPSSAQDLVCNVVHLVPLLITLTLPLMISKKCVLCGEMLQFGTELLLLLLFVVLLVVLHFLCDSAVSQLPGVPIRPSPEFSSAAIRTVAIANEPAAGCLLGLFS